MKRHRGTNFDALEGRSVPTGAFSRQFVAQVLYDLTSGYAAPSDVSTFSGLLDAGSSKTQVAGSILGTPQVRADLVSGLYLSLLQRPVDPLGLAGYTGMLSGGATIEQVESSLVGSTEYFNTRDAGGTDHFLDTLGPDLLGRALTTAERSADRAALAQGTTRAGLASSVASTAEAAQWFVRDRLGNIAGSLNQAALAGAGPGVQGVIAATLASPQYAARAQQMSGILAFRVTPQSGFDTTRLGGSATFTVSLSRPPSSNVTIGVASSNTSEGTVTPSPLTFTPSNWQTPQAFTVTGANDGQSGSNVPYSVLFSPAISGDPSFKGLSFASIAMTNRDGVTASFAPSFVAQVLYDLTSGYAAPSDVSTFSGLLDAGSSKTQVAGSILGTPQVRADLVSGLYLSLLQRPVDPLGLAGYTGMLSGGATIEQVESSLVGSTEYFNTRDAGGTDHFLDTLGPDLLGRALTTAERSADRAALAQGTTRAGLASSVASTAEAAQWFVRDRLGNIAGSLNQAALAGAGPGVQGVIAATLASPQYAARAQQMSGILAFRVTPQSGFDTTRLGGSATFTVSLSRPPSSNVTIGVASSNTSEGTVTPSPLTFTPSNWQTPQAFTVTGANDGQSGSNVPYSVLFSPAISGDPSFKGLSFASIAMTNRDGVTSSFDASTNTIDFSVASPCVTTCVVVDANGQFIRTLWSLQETSAGNHTSQWDGLDDQGNVAPAGTYSILISANVAAYANVGVIGNSGQTAATSDHTPVDMTSVAIGSDGGIYTADVWDEAGADFKKWDASGNSVYDANFQVRNGTPYALPYTIAVDQNYIYCAVTGEDAPYPQLIERFRTSDGLAAPWNNGDPNGHISVSNQAPQGQNYPLRAMVVSGNSLWVADSLDGNVLQYDKTSGLLISQFAVQDPEAIAVDAAGRLWIGYDDHNVGVYEPDATLLGVAISNLDQVVSLTFGPNGDLYVADSGAGQVKIYAADFSSGQVQSYSVPSAPVVVNQVGSLGQKANPGDRAASDFYDLLGVAVEPNGSIVTIQTEAPNGGSRLASFDGDGQVQWEQYGNEFVSVGTYAQDNPGVLYTNSFHAYDLTDKATGSWTYANNTYSGPSTSYDQPLTGVPRIIHYGSSDFYFEPSGDGLQVYRIEGTTFHLAALVGGEDPGSDGIDTTQGGEWTWDDSTGSGMPTAVEIQWFQQPGSGQQYETRGMEVDNKGNIFFEDQFSQQIWEIPIGTPDALGNPTYNWTQKIVVFGKDQSPLGLQPQSVQHADDGSYYVLGWSTPWPDPSSPLWMGGSTLVKYDAAGTQLWAVHLPEICTGMDLVPGGGVMLGGGTSATIYQYTPDGMLIGSMSPGAAMANTSGWLDNQGSIAVDRDPRTGNLDIFAENDYGLNVGWYEVSNQYLQEVKVTGVVPAQAPPAPPDVTATPDQAGEIIVSWDAVSGATGYVLERSTDGVTWTRVIGLPASATATTDLGLQPSTLYYYRVNALWNDPVLDGQSLGHAPIGGVSAVTSATTVSASSDALFSDSFNESSTPGPDWTFPHGTWAVGPDGLSQTSPEASNSKALIGDQSYPTDIRITAKLRVDSWTDGDNNVRVGIGLHADGTILGYGGGYFLDFDGNQNTVMYGNDEAGYGNSYAFAWNVGQWYMFDLEYKNGTLYGNIWADGTAEPTTWMFVQPGWTLRPNGAPALGGGSNGNDGSGSSDATFNYVEVRPAT